MVILLLYDSVEAGLSLQGRWRVLPVPGLHCSLDAADARVVHPIRAPSATAASACARHGDMRLVAIPRAQRDDCRQLRGRALHSGEMRLKCCVRAAKISEAGKSLS